MPNQATLAEIEIAELTQTVDDGRAPADPFKLPATLRTLLDTRLADLKTKDAATLTTEGGRAGGACLPACRVRAWTFTMRPHNEHAPIPPYCHSPARRRLHPGC